MASGLSNSQFLWWNIVEQYMKDANCAALAASLLFNKCDTCGTCSNPNRERGDLAFRQPLLVPKEWTWDPLHTLKCPLCLSYHPINPQSRIIVGIGCCAATSFG